MRVTCDQCQAQYELDPQQIPPEGINLQCQQCGNIFIARRPLQPVAIPQTTTWYLKKSDGQVYNCENFSTLQRWIREDKAHREDQVSNNARTWIGLETVSGLKKVVDETETRREMERQIEAEQAQQPKMTMEYSALPQQFSTPETTPQAPVSQAQPSGQPQMTAEMGAVVPETATAGPQFSRGQHPSQPQMTAEMGAVVPETTTAGSQFSQGQHPSQPQMTAEMGAVMPETAASGPQFSQGQHPSQPQMTAEMGAVMPETATAGPQFSQGQHPSQPQMTAEMGAIATNVGTPSTESTGGTPVVESAPAPATTPAPAPRSARKEAAFEPPLHRKTNEELLAEELEREATRKGRRNRNILITFLVLVVLGIGAYVGYLKLMQRPELTQEQKNGIAAIQSLVNRFDQDSLDKAIAKAEAFSKANPDLPEALAAQLQALVASSDFTSIKVEQLEAESAALQAEYQKADKEEQARIVEEQQSIKDEGTALQETINQLSRKAGEITQKVWETGQTIPAVQIAIADYYRLAGAERAGKAQEMLDLAKAAPNKNDAEFLFVQGAVLATNPELKQEAIDTLKDTYAKDGTMLKAQFMIARLQTLAGQYDKATQTLEGVLGNHPDHALSQEMLGYLEGLSVPDSIVAADVKAMEAKSIAELGKKLLKKQRFDDALKVYESGLEAYSNNADLRSGLAFVQLNQGQYDDALATFEKVLKDKPRHKSTIMGLAMTYMMMQNKEKATEYAGNYVKWFPADESVEKAQKILDAMK